MSMYAWMRLFVCTSVSSESQRGGESIWVPVKTNAAK